MHARLSSPDYFTPRAAPAPVATTSSALESAHPEMARNIVLLSGHPEMNAWFDRIWSGDAGSALGPEAIAELMLLSQMHRWLMPAPAPQLALPTQRTRRSGDPWDSGFRR